MTFKVSLHPEIAYWLDPIATHPTHFNLLNARNLWYVHCESSIPDSGAYRNDAYPGYLAVSLLIYLVLGFLGPVSGAVNFTQCLSNIRNETWRQESQISDGATDNHGQPIPFSNFTTAVTYELCVSACGPGPGPMQWSVFSQQFSSWLLPWLALVSQLPFGANDKFDNLMAMLLTVGSPTLAAYSLALTVLNGRWIARRFSSYNYPNTRNAVRILASLQQAPVQVSSDESLLSSLVVLPKNDEWWTELVVWLDYTYTWSISAAASIIWVVIAYLFTIIDSFSGDVITAINASGQSVGSVWLWLLPVVVGWLQISPKCDSERLDQAVSRANRIAYVATPNGEPKLASLCASKYAISLRPGTGDILRCDEACTVPIFNYARFLSWVEAVETVADAFRVASERARVPVSTDPEIQCAEEKIDSQSHVPNRMDALACVEDNCALMGKSQCMRRMGWWPDVWSRMFIASVLALSLQWGTAGGAVVVVWFTPTIGKSSRSEEHMCCSYRVGCRSWMSVGVIHTLRRQLNSRLATARCLEYFIPLCDDDILPHLGLAPSDCTPNVHRTSSHRQSRGGLQRNLDYHLVHVPVQQLLLSVLLRQ